MVIGQEAILPFLLTRMRITDTLHKCFQRYHVSSCSLQLTVAFCNGSLNNTSGLKHLNPRNYHCLLTVHFPSSVAHSHFDFIHVASLQLNKVKFSDTTPLRRNSVRRHRNLATQPLTKFRQGRWSTHPIHPKQCLLNMTVRNSDRTFLARKM